MIHQTRRPKLQPFPEPSQAAKISPFDPTKVERTTIQWRDGAYRVDRTGWDGGEVVPAADYDALVEIWRDAIPYLIVEDMVTAVRTSFAGSGTPCEQIADLILRNLKTYRQNYTPKRRTAPPRKG